MDAGILVVANRRLQPEGGKTLKWLSRVRRLKRGLSTGSLSRTSKLKLEL
jgi:hypothetical protein